MESAYLKALGEKTLWPVPHSDGTTDLFIKLDSFHDVFCPDASDQQAARMAATQRPATQEALVEPSGERSLWKELPSWFLIGEDDRVIPAALQEYMAGRAGAHRVLEIPGASHAALVSHPDATAHLILEAGKRSPDRLIDRPKNGDNEGTRRLQIAARGAKQ